MSLPESPVIGITSYVEPARFGVWDTRAALIPYSYVHAVRSAGGAVVVLPPDDAAAAVLVRRLDGVVLAGGADVSPDRYGADAHPTTVTRPDRDAGELAVLGAALVLGMPVLGVCRGMQLMAVACGGALHQHLPDVLGNTRHQPAPGVFGGHEVRLTPGSLAATVLGPVTEVNSHHHQAVTDPGRLRVTGLADDGTVEAVEDPDRPFVLGVQWHPEEAGDLRLFAALTDAARRYAEERSGTSTQPWPVAALG